MKQAKRFSKGLTLCVLSMIIAVMIHIQGDSIVFSPMVTLTAQAPPRTVVSISSFGQRIFRMAPTLDSVLSQSLAPDRIIITIPNTHRKSENTSCSLSDCPPSSHVIYNESRENILAWFAVYTGAHFEWTNRSGSTVFEFPRLTVQFLDQDRGPATKVLGALLLERDPETVIITFDDDLIYNYDTVRWLASHIGRDMALSFGCEIWGRRYSTFYAYTEVGLNNLFASTPRVCKGWLVGWTAVAYRVGHFGSDVFTYLNRLPRGCFFNDDVWLSGYIARRGVLKVYAPNVMEHVYHRRDRELSLSTIDGTMERYRIPCASALFA